MKTLSFSIPLIKTKLLVPELRPGFVHRPRLTAILDKGMLHPLTLVSAPAGFGKTTLLAEWASQRRAPLAWLTVGPEDNDVLRFYVYLIGALRSLHPQVGEETLSLLQNNRPETLEAGLTFLINDLSTVEEEFVLVLDEFHHIQEPSVYRSLRFLLGHLPPALNLMIATRSDLPFSYTRLRAKGDLVEIRADDLRFTKAEIAEFLKGTMHMEVAERELEILEEHTEGWITGLQLAAISLRSQPDIPGFLARAPGNAQLVMDFLLDEVFRQQPQEVQQFLLRTSILETICAPLSEAVMQAEKAGPGKAMLERLDRENLFMIALDEGRQWFRYHPIFSSFLRYQLDQTKREEISELHRRASSWYAGYGDLEAAIKHALWAGDNEGAADLIEDNFDRLLQEGLVLTLAKWIRNLPDMIGETRPHLCLAVAWSYLSTLDLDRAKYWAEAAAAQAQKQIAAGAVPGAPAGRETRKQSELLGQAAVYRALLATLQGNSQLTLKFMREALDSLPEEDLFWRSFVIFDQAILHFLSGDTPQTVRSLMEAIQAAGRSGNLFLKTVATCQLGEVQAIQGQLSRALSTYQQVAPIAKDPHGAPLPLAGTIYMGVGEILRERNQFSEAEASLELGIKLSRLWIPPGAIDGYISLARLRNSLGDQAGARRLLAKAGRLAELTEASDWDDMLVALQTTRLLLQQNDLPSAIQYAHLQGLLNDQHEVVIVERPAFLGEQLKILQARFWLAFGLQEGPGASTSLAGSSALYLARAVENLHSLRCQVESGQHFGYLIEMLVLLALAEQGLGNLPEAYEALRQAFVLAETEGYIRIFVDEGAPMRSLLAGFRAQSRWEEKQRWQAYLDQLAAAWGPPEPGAEAVGAAFIEGDLPTTPKAIHPTPPAMVDRQDLIEPLTRREEEVLRLIASGHSNREIALRLCIELNTVKRHASNVYAKLGVKKRTQAVTLARRLGILP